MKQLFYIHSNITYLVAKAIIDYHQLKDEQVILFFTRNVRPVEEDIRRFDTYVFKNILEFNYHINIFRAWPKLIKFKKILKKITGGNSYYIYVPHTHRREVQILIHNSLCESFAIMEEGTDSYLEKDKLVKQHQPKKVNLFEKLNYLNLVKSNEFIQSDYKNLYGISERSFPGYERKIVLNNVLKSDTESEASIENKNLLILDAVSVYNDISRETHVSSIRKMLDYFVDHHITEVLYKYHPSQINSREEEAFEALFKEYKSKLILKRLDDNIIVEHLITNGRDLKFFVNTSSLGMYASAYGHEVYSFAHYIVERDHNYSGFSEFYPRHYIDNICFLS